MYTSFSPRPVVAFDPFGEPVAEGVARACPSWDRPSRDGTSDAGDRTARRIGGAVFWGLALLILAGRVYAYDMPVVSQVASYATHLVAMR